MIASAALSLSSRATHVRPVRIHWSMVMQSCVSLRPGPILLAVIFFTLSTALDILTGCIHSLIFFLIDVQPRIYSCQFPELRSTPPLPSNITDHSTHTTSEMSGNRNKSKSYHGRQVLFFFRSHFPACAAHTVVPSCPRTP